MAVDIKQVVIKAVLTRPNQSDAGTTDPEQRRALVQECVDQTLKILKNKNRR